MAFPWTYSATFRCCGWLMDVDRYRLQAMSLGSCLALCTVTCESAYPYFQNVAVPLYVTQSHAQTFKYQD